MLNMSGWKSLLSTNLNSIKKGKRRNNDMNNGNNGSSNN